MKSIVLCEGRDDLWFIGYYLHKKAGWCQCKEPWKTYHASPLDSRQTVIYLSKGDDSVAIWSVAGKDRFEPVVKTIFERFIENYPFDPIDSIAIMSDRDSESTSDVLQRMQGWFSNSIPLQNKLSSLWFKNIDGYSVSVSITPVVIPFSEEGAIETLLIRSISEKSQAGNTIALEANKYIDNLLANSEVSKNYLLHARQVLKGRYSAVIAAINPEHSTALFEDLVMTTPWENSKTIQEHFNVIVSAISSC